MLGFDQASELIGRSLDVMMTATDSARHDGYISARRGNAGAQVIGVPGRELLAVRRDGSEFPIELSVSSFGIDGSHRLMALTTAKRMNDAFTAFLLPFGRSLCPNSRKPLTS